MRGREMTAWVTAAVTTAAAAVAGAMLFSSRPGPPAADAEIAVLSIVPPAGAELVSGEAPQISPDGRRLAFVATDRTGRAGLYVRELDAVEATRLADTEDVTLPFWAPDSRRVGFFARGQLRTVSIAGGQVRVLAPAPVPRGGTWNREDVILFIPLPIRPPHRVSAAGGPAVPVPVVAAERTRWFPSFLPDGRHYLYVSASVGSGDRALKVGALDSSDTQVLVPSQANAVYLASGHVLYRADGALVAHPFDHEARRLTGEPVVVVGDLGFNAITYQALYSASDAGTIAWQASRPTSELVWFDRAGKRLDVAVGAGHYTAFCLAAGDRRIVFEAADAISGNVDLWITDALGGTPSRLTFDTAVDFYPVCSPTSDAVVFSSLRDGAPNLYRLDLARPGTEGRLLASPVPKIATDWSRDGRALLFWLLAPTTGSDIWTVGSDGAGARAIVASDAQERDGRLSPDGRWIAYHSNETGEAEVYVRPFPAGPGTWQVSTGGGMQPQWQRDGRQLYYLTPDNRLVSVAVQSGSSGISFAAPTVLMPLRLAGWEPGRGQYAVTADGTRVLVSSKTDEALSITLKTRWAPAAPR